MPAPTPRPDEKSTPACPGWIRELAANSPAPGRAAASLAALHSGWPPEFPPLREVVGGFPAGAVALGHLLAISPVSGEKLVRRPADLMWLADPAICTGSRGYGRMRADLLLDRGGAAGFDPSFAALRALKSREMLRIAVRDVAGLAPVEETTRELSDLAELCVREVYEGWRNDPRLRWDGPDGGFAILAMGKFGGRELNYSSDIDLIFLSGDDGPLDGGVTRHQFFSRLAERISRTFSESSGAGPLFRIDLRLRPEGGSGPIVRSLESAVHYYAGFGETWERMALIKARGICGDPGLIYEFEHQLQPFIYPKIASTELVREVAAIKLRIENEIVGAGGATRNVKLGRGGIREIEFTVQSLQLLYGARNAFLQERNTLKALDALANLAIMPTDETGALAGAYRFLRTVEHRLQIVSEQQTHSIPVDPAGQEILARSLGFPSPAAFLETLGAHTARVRAIFEQVVRTAADDAQPAPDGPVTFFADAAAAMRTLDRMSGDSTRVHVAPRTRQIFANLRPLLLAQLRQIPEPDAALTRFVRFVEVHGLRGLLFESLLTNPRLLELLIKLFDASPFLSEVVFRRPSLIEEIARGGSLGETFSAGRYRGILRDNQEGIDPLEWIRVARRGQILRILLRDILDIATPDDVQSEYSALAEACVAECLASLGINETLTVVAMGKFGGRELAYGSDLDLIYVGDDDAAAGLFTRTMNAITPEGLIFPVDARLRPEGASGRLAVGPSAYEAYFFNGRAQFWEAQALTKARPLAGPDGGWFAGFALEAWSRFAGGHDVLAEVRAMRDRIVRERAGRDHRLDFKTGEGGIIDVEFLCQALQMKHRVPEQNTSAALEKLVTAGHLLHGEWDSLRAGYRFLRRTESVLRRREVTAVSTLPADPAAQHHLAARLGFHSTTEFFEAYSGHRSAIHRIWQDRMTA